MNRNIPESWHVQRLDEVCEIILGQSPPSSTYNKSRKGIPFFQGKKDFGKVHPMPTVWCSEPIRIAKKNDILISVRAPVGSLNIADQQCCIGRGLGAIRYNPNYKYLYFYLKSISNEIEQKGIGTTFSSISGKDLRSISVPLPPLPEQHRIVEKIVALFSELDNGIASLIKAKDQLKVYRQSVLKWAFEGRLTKGWRINTSPEPAISLFRQIREKRDKEYHLQLTIWKRSVYVWEKNGKLGRRPNKPNTVAVFLPFTKKEIIELSNIPKGWIYAKSGEIISPINNGYTPKSNFLSPDAGEIPFIKVYNLKFDGTFNFNKNPTYIPRSIHKNDLLRSITYPNDILINIVGPPLGKVSIVPDIYSEWNINQAIVLFRPNQFITSKYISYWLQNPVTIHWLENTSKATAGQFNIKVSTCREIPLPLCSYDEQIQIVKEIEARLLVADKLEKTIDETLLKTEALRQSILKSAFEGRLVQTKANKLL